MFRMMISTSVISLSLAQWTSRSRARQQQQTRVVRVVAVRHISHRKSYTTPTIWVGGCTSSDWTEATAGCRLSVRNSCSNLSINVSVSLYLSICVGHTVCLVIFCPHLLFSSLPLYVYAIHTINYVFAIPCYVMFCYVMLCYVMICYVMLCFVRACYGKICCVMSCYAMSSSVMSCFIMLCVERIRNNRNIMDW